jgi:hypothetical protein
MRCLLTPNTILLLTGVILTLKIITDGDHSLLSNLWFLSGVRSVCGCVRPCADRVRFFERQTHQPLDQPLLLYLCSTDEYAVGHCLNLV